MNGPDRRTATAAELRRHPAVADAAVTAAPAGATAYVVPDPDEAPLLHRACGLEGEVRRAGLSWHEPADDLLVAQVNRTETDFLYQETFRDEVYLRHGITLAEAAIVVDAGANIGMVTLFTAARSQGARVVAIEPVAELAGAIRINAELHQVDVTIVNCALGAAAGDGELTFYPGNTVMSGLHADRDEDQEVLRNYLLTGDGVEGNHHLDAMVADRMAGERRPCRIVTLSQVVTQQRLERIDLLKIDVEKAESDVLAGIDDRTWDLIDQVVVEVHDLDGRLAQTLELLADRRFMVASDRDRRLELTPCHTVYAHRPRPDRRPPSPPSAPRWPTRRALTGELRAHLGRGSTPVPDRFVFVATLDCLDGLDGLGGRHDITGTHGVVDGVRNGDVPVDVGPGTAVLAEIWADLFGAAAVRDDADFFDLGGDSLTGVRLLARIEARLGEDVLAPDVVFTHSRFSDLATAVSAGLAARAGQP